MHTSKQAKRRTSSEYLGPGWSTYHLPLCHHIFTFLCPPNLAPESNLYCQQYTSHGTHRPSHPPTPPLPPNIASRFIDCTPHSLIFHILESGNPSSPLILLVHGFPELAYSWRHVIPLLSSSYHVVAVDQRGYGRTHPSSPSRPLPPSSFRPVNLIRDILALTSALGHTSIACIAGHDFGAVTAALVTLARPDLVKSCMLLSHPFKGPPTLPFNTAANVSTPKPPPPINTNDELALLTPPRKHYKHYYCTSSAASDLSSPPGKPLHDFLRGYFHLKSADWPHNHPHRLPSSSAADLATMPGYYIMPLSSTMRETIAADLASCPAEELAQGQRWLSDAELDVYVSEYERTTFEQPLRWYKTQIDPEVAGDVEVWSGRKIEVPTMFVAGVRDWGTFQEKGAVEAMEEGESVARGMYRGTVLVEGAGHWVNQENALEVSRLILDLVGSVT